MMAQNRTLLNAAAAMSRPRSGACLGVVTGPVAKHDTVVNRGGYRRPTTVKQGTFDTRSRQVVLEVVLLMVIDTST